MLGEGLVGRRGWVHGLPVMRDVGVDFLEPARTRTQAFDEDILHHITHVGQEGLGREPRFLLWIVGEGDGGLD